ELVIGDMISAEAQQAAAVVRLSQLLGRPGPELAIAAPVNMPGSQALLIERARGQSPTLERLRAQVRVVNYEIRQAKSALFPDIFLRAERQYGNSSVGNAGPTNRVFVGVRSQFGAGLSAISNIGA